MAVELAEAGSVCDYILSSV